MQDSARDSLPHPANAAEKRAFVRNAIYLPAECIASGRPVYPVDILDFCPGGVFLSFQRGDGAQAHRLVPGDLVALRCAIAMPGGGERLQFQGRVARADAACAGIAFINPSFDALHALYDYAKTHPHADAGRHEVEGGDKGGAPVVEGQAAQFLLRGCRRLVVERAEPMVAAFLGLIRDRLFAMAGEVRMASEKNVFYAAQSLFANNGNVFKTEFGARVQAAVDQGPTSAGRAVSGAAREELALVEEDAFEDWLAMTDMARAAELDFQAQLSELERRLSAVFRVPIGRENNPFGPGTLAQAFLDALKPLALDRKAVSVCCGVFKQVLSDNVGGLYDALNRHLAENGVLANLKASDFFKPTQAGGVASPPAATAARREARAEPVDTAEIARLSAPWIPAGARPSDLSAWAAQAPQDWYRLVSGLGSLQQFIARRVTPAGGERAPEAVAPDFYTPEEVSLALSRVEAADDTITSPQDFRRDFAARLRAALGVPGVVAGAKTLPARERNILELGGELFGSALADKLVADTVKPWLKRLSIPMIKMALKDDSVFFDKSNPARELINRLAELELHGESTLGETLARKKIDGLLREMAASEEASPELIERMLKEVGLLIYLQNRAYEENVREIFTASQSEEPSPEPVEARATEEDIDDASLRESRKRVRRLKEGSRLSLALGGEHRTLRLARVDEGAGRYVFVNGKGRKEAILDRETLARKMRDGAAAVVEDAGEPLVDRAQAAMLQNLHRELVHQSAHDQLTGLANRREFEKRVAEALARAQQSGMESMVCYLALDPFDASAGSEAVLADVARRLSGVLGEGGVLARVGDDAFAMLLEPSTVEDALVVLARQQAAVRGNGSAMSFCAGLVPLDPGSDSAAGLMRAAETCCGSARARGPGEVELYRAAQAGSQEEIQTELWAQSIDDVLEHDRLELRCQPIVSIGGRSVSVLHSEVLLAVPDEQGKLASPTDFIQAAEGFRRMASVDRWVIEHAFRWLVDRRAKLGSLGGLAIKLSSASLGEDGLVGYVLSRASRLGVPMDKVCFEITEAEETTHPSDTAEFMHALKAAGCTFCLDDFAGGESSYAYLKNLPVDFLKIDGAFVKGMDRNECDFAVVKSITEIAHFMGKKVIAEQVESEAVLKMLRDIGVDYAQGYFTGKPRKLKVLGA